MADDNTRVDTSNHSSDGFKAAYELAKSIRKTGPDNPTAVCDYLRTLITDESGKLVKFFGGVAQVNHFLALYPGGWVPKTLTRRMADLFVKFHRTVVQGNYTSSDGFGRSKEETEFAGDMEEAFITLLYLYIPSIVYRNYVETEGLRISDVELFTMFCLDVARFLEQEDTKDELKKILDGTEETTQKFYIQVLNDLRESEMKELKEMKHYNVHEIRTIAKNIFAENTGEQKQQQQQQNVNYRDLFLAEFKELKGYYYDEDGQKKGEHKQVGRITVRPEKFNEKAAPLVEFFYDRTLIFCRWEDLCKYMYKKQEDEKKRNVGYWSRFKNYARTTFLFVGRRFMSDNMRQWWQEPQEIVIDTLSRAITVPVNSSQQELFDTERADVRDTINVYKTWLAVARQIYADTVFSSMEHAVKNAPKNVPFQKIVQSIFRLSIAYMRSARVQDVDVDTTINEILRVAGSTGPDRAQRSVLDMYSSYGELFNLTIIAGNAYA